MSYTVAFFGAFQIRMIQVLLVVCVLLWVTSFVDTGYLESEEEAKRIYQNLLVVSVASAACFAPIIWIGVDRWHLGYLISGVFAVRAIVLIFGFPNLTLPNGFGAYISCCVLLTTSGIANILCETFFIKKTPCEISGSMKGVFNFFGQIGTLILTLVSGYMYDMVSPASPFIVVGVLDFLLCLLSIGLSLAGKMKV